MRRNVIRRNVMRSNALTLALAATLLAGCTVGPKYVRPDVPLPTVFDQGSAEQSDAAPGTSVWKAFDDQTLDRLIARTLEANTTIAQAQARFEETRSLAGLSFFSLFPTVTSGAGVTRSKPSGDDPFIPPTQGNSDVYRAGFDASWEIDLFGGLRNPSRAIHARRDADAAALRGARLSMVAETAQAYFSLRGAQRRLALAKENLAAADEVLRVTQVLADNGRLNNLDLSRATSQRDALAAALPEREVELVRNEQRLAVLTAQPVAQVREQVGESVGFPVLPEMVTIGTPETWLRRRPDIEAAERRLAASYNDVGEEVAQFFPKLIFNGAFGWTGQAASAIGSMASERWEWGPTLTWRFLDFGRVRQYVKAAEARADGSEALYRETVLRALEETENALAGYRASNRSSTELGNAAKAAGEASRACASRPAPTICCRCCRPSRRGSNSKIRRYRRRPRAPPHWRRSTRRWPAILRKPKRKRRLRADKHRRNILGATGVATDG
jgi:multidrug efflux system outer membrane protein